MISVFSFPDGSSLVNKVWSPSVSLSSLYRIDNNVHELSCDEFSASLLQQTENSVGCYYVDVHSGDVVEHRIGCSGAFNLFLGTERLTICFTTERVSHVFIETGFQPSSLNLLPKIDPSCIATDYYGLSRGIRPLSVLCFDDFKVALYNDLGSGLDLKCNYVLMQDEQEIGYFGAQLNGGSLNPIPVTAKGLRKYLVSQGSRRIPIKSDFSGSNYEKNFGIVRTTAAVSRAKSFFEDIRLGNQVSTGSWMNLVYMPDQNFLTRPTASLVGVRACNTASVNTADEIILEASMDSTCFSKLAACVAGALLESGKLARASVPMLLIVNANEFDSLVDKLQLQKSTFKNAVDDALTKLVSDAQNAIKLELSQPWDIACEMTVTLPKGMPIAEERSTFEELCALNEMSRRHGCKKTLSFNVSIPSLDQCFSFPIISKENRQSALEKFGDLYDINMPKFSNDLSSDGLLNNITDIIGTKNVKSRVSSKVSNVIREKVEEAVSQKLANIISVLTCDKDTTFNPQCNGAAAREVGWMSNFQIGPFPGEWHTDVSMPDYGMYGEFGLDLAEREASYSGGGLWSRAGKSSYKFPLKRFYSDFPIAEKFSLEKINAVLERYGENKVQNLYAACYVPSFIYNPRVTVVSAEKRNVQLELHFGYAGCPAPVLSSFCTNLKAMNQKYLEEKIARLDGALVKPLGSSYDYCVLLNHEDKTFGSPLGCWFDTGARTVHVGYRRQQVVKETKMVPRKTERGWEFRTEQHERLEWTDPYAVSPYFYYEVMVPINIELSSLDKSFQADDKKSGQIAELLSTINNRAELLSNLSNLKEIMNLMAQTNSYEELKLLGATEKSLLNPSMAACFTDLNVSDSAELCSELLSSLKELRSKWGELFEPGSPGAADSSSEGYQNLLKMIEHLSEALKSFTCKTPPVFFSASQVVKTTTIFDGGSINLLLV